MIIEDSEDNQYVWIPIFTKEQYSWGVDYSSVNENTDEYYTEIQTALKNYTATYVNEKYADEWYGSAERGKKGYYKEGNQENVIYYSNGNMTEEEYNILYNKMLKSVYENEGFYIGRYEMGIAVVNGVEEIREKTRGITLEYKCYGELEDNEEPSIEGMTVPISKANAVGYSNITQSQAQMLAEKVGEKTDYSNVTSSIMFGVQWDAVCVFIENFDTNNKATTKSDWLLTNDYSKLWGNYQNASFKLDRGFYNGKQDYITKKGTEETWLCTTGASEQNKSLNIYDFAGNLREYTLESRKSVGINPGCFRGGNYYSNTKFYAGHRFFVSVYHWGEMDGSRVTIYIN